MPIPWQPETMTTTRYTITATAMKTWKTNGVLLRNRQIHGKFIVTVFRKHVCHRHGNCCGRYGLWSSLSNPQIGLCHHGCHLQTWQWCALNVNITSIVVHFFKIICHFLLLTFKVRMCKISDKVTNFLSNYKNLFSNPSFIWKQCIYYFVCFLFAFMKIHQFKCLPFSHCIKDEHTE